MLRSGSAAHRLSHALHKPFEHGQFQSCGPQQHVAHTARKVGMAGRVAAAHLDARAERLEQLQALQVLQHSCKRRQRAWWAAILRKGGHGLRYGTERVFASEQACSHRGRWKLLRRHLCELGAERGLFQHPQQR